MAYKTIVAHFNDERRAPALLRTSLRLARTHEAHLIGLAVLPPVIIVPGTEGDVGAVISDHREQYRPQVMRMREAFETAKHETGVGGEWRELDAQDENPFGDVGTVALEHARCADLVIASGANPAWNLSTYLDVPERLVMESGRPVLLLPKAPFDEQVGTRVLLAWNGSREAARVTFEALPLLHAAQNVLVAQIGENSASEEQRSLPRADICKALARHNVKCEMLPPIPQPHDIGVALVEAATRARADLMVMGCYGHSRLREMLLGGASRHVLRHLPMPVLMSH